VAQPLEPPKDHAPPAHTAHVVLLAPPLEDPAGHTVAAAATEKASDDDAAMTTTAMKASDGILKTVLLPN